MFILFTLLLLTLIQLNSFSILLKELALLIDQSNICLISLSLREQSLFVILLEKENNRVQNIEKIKLGKRMRHFGTKLNGDIFFDDDYFFVSTDDLTILKIKFLNFR